MPFVPLRMMSHRVFGRAQDGKLFFGFFPIQVNLWGEKGFQIGATHSSNGRTSDLYNSEKASGFDGPSVLKTRPRTLLALLTVATPPSLLDKSDDTTTPKSLKWYYDQKVTSPFIFIFRKYLL